ncbi:hypothetical protein [Granulicella tundricola]|uniref:hypothetical protein n=1 Tax=Granulicella tundricola TaxID=940615 RepID=UPI0001DB7623|nr:hypothetical protein [Granulicella tundricola]
MIGPIVLPPQIAALPAPDAPYPQKDPESAQSMDPLSEVLALMKPQSLACGGFAVPGDVAISFPKH